MKESSRRINKVQEGLRRFKKVQEGSRRFKKVQEDSRRFKKSQVIFKAHSGHIQITFGSQFRKLPKVPEGSRRFKEVQEGSIYIQGTFRTHSNHICVTNQKSKEGS